MKFLRRFSLSSEQHTKLINAKKERAESEKGLQQAQTVLSFIEKIREENHFSADFRKALGER